MWIQRESKIGFKVGADLEYISTEYLLKNFKPCQYSENEEEI